MKPDDLCIVDMDGKQVSGKRKRSSEILLHLSIMKARPDVRSVRPLPSAPRHRVRRRARADPQVRPARVRGLPRRGGDLALRDARRQTFADTVLPYVKDTDTILLANHGTVTYGSDLEDAYFKTEIIDAYCRILILAKQLGRVNYYADEKAAELIKLKPNLGIPDPRLEPRPRELRPLRQQPVPRGLRRLQPRAARCSSTPSSPAAGPTSRRSQRLRRRRPSRRQRPRRRLDVDALVKTITDQVDARA